MMIPQQLTSKGSIAAAHEVGACNCIILSALEAGLKLGPDPRLPALLMAVPAKAGANGDII